MSDPRTAIQQTELMRNLLAFLLIGAFISTLPLFVFKTIPEGNKEIITYIAGQLSGMALMALGFYFVNKVGADAADAQKAENTGKMADAVIAAAKAGTGEASEPAVNAAEQVADAAVDEAKAIKGKSK